MTDAPPPAAREFDALAEALAEQGAARSRMMGRPMLTLDGRMFACLDAGMLGLRLGEQNPAHAEALALPGAEIFSPGQGRRFRDWVSLPVDRADDWERFAVAAMHHVAALRR